MKNIIWQGTVDNLELSGMPNGDQQPMRVVEDDDKRLMTEYASDSENDQGEIEYDESSGFLIIRADSETCSRNRVLN
jgi:hypothetical protein